MLEQYRNFDKRIITQQQAIGSHYKDFLEDNGLLKIREHRLGSKIKSVLYYKAQGETLSEIVSIYNNIPTVKSIYIREREAYGTYTIEEEKTYWRNTDLELLEPQPFIMRWLYNSHGDNVAYEAIDSALSANDPYHRVVNKSYKLGIFSEDNNEERSCITTGYRGYNEPFDYMAYVPVGQTFDDQDIKYMDLQETINFMTGEGIPQSMQDWYLNDVFLPPL